MQAAEWDEQSELRELNSRLQLYVSRVRGLEQENRRLAQEVAALRGRGRAQDRLEEREEEVLELRLAVAELRRARGAAELERDALRRELARLERLGAETVELRRRRLEPQLAEQRQQLQLLRADCAALEALLERLGAEHGRLQEERRRRPVELPALPAPPPPLSRRELEETCALVLSWSCAQSLERYEAELRALQELEGSNRLDGQELQELLARNQQSRRQLQDLQRRCGELSALAERFDAERLAQRERHGAQLAEYQMIIEALEEEKQLLAMSIAEYLKDYHELLQVKAGLSLEIATYRALLEGESSQWILMWDEQHGRKLPQGVRNMLYEYSNRHSAYQQDKRKRILPAIQNVDTRYKPPVTNRSSSAVYSSQTRSGGMQAAASGKMSGRDALKSEYRSLAAIRKDTIRERTMTEQREIRSFAQPYPAGREGGVQRGMVPKRKRPEAGINASVSKESTTVQKVAMRPDISENVRTKVGVPSAFPSYSLSSSSQETKYERTVDGTRRRVTEQIRDNQLGKEGTSVLVEEKVKIEQLGKGVTDSGLEKIDKKSAPVERSLNLRKEVEIRPGVDVSKRTMEELIINNSRKEGRFMGSETAKDGKYGRWEEQIRVDTSEKDFAADVKTKGSRLFDTEVSTAAHSKKAVEIPICSEAQTRSQTWKDENIEVTLQGSKPSEGQQRGELSREPNRDGRGEEGAPKMGTFLTESMAENIVSDILKGLVQESSTSGPPPDTKVTFFEKRVSEDGKVKTEVNIQSTVQEDLNVPGASDLESFLKKDVTKVLEDSKGTLAEGVIKDIINAGLQAEAGKEKRTVQVEIVEEPVEYTTAGRMEFSTPFEVEEAEETWPGALGFAYYGDERRATTSVAEDLKKKQPTVIVSHVEEVPEGDEVVDEEKYFVCTPDEQPLVHEQDEGSVYGQIHIEEESTIKYSWQDEFLQGSQTRVNEGVGSPELIYQLMEGEAGSFISKEEPPKEQVAHAESVVFEREIKIPHEFQESIKGLFSQETKDPKQQLKEALEKLEDTLPESVKRDLSAITKEAEADSSSLEVDIKKVEHSKSGEGQGGLVTIVAEVSLSQTLDPDQFNSGYLGITDTIKSPAESSRKDGFDEYGRQELEGIGDDGKKVEIGVSSTPWTVEEVSSSANLRSSDGMEYHTNEQVVHQAPAFKSMDFDSEGDASSSQSMVDSGRSIRKITVGPTEIRRTEQVLYEGPISETQTFGTGELADVSQSVKEVKFGPQGIETMEEIVYQGPVHKTMQLSDSGSPSQVLFSSGVRSTKHITLGSQKVTEEVVFEGSTSSDSGDALSQIKGPVETNRSIRHIRIDPQEVHTEQVIFEGPLSRSVELGSGGNRTLTQESVRHVRLGQRDTSMADPSTYEEHSPKMTQSSHASETLFKEGVVDTSTTIRHIQWSPREFVRTAEQTVFSGPVSEQRQEFAESGQTFSSEGSIKHIQLGQKELRNSERVVYQGSVSESSGISSAGEDVSEAEGPVEISRSFKQIRVSPAEMRTEQFIFQGPVLETQRLGATDGPSESNKSAGHIKIGPKETSFTFQMDVTHMAGGGQEATILVPKMKGADAHQREGKGMDAQEETESKRRAEEATFEQTVQLQRMVDQRSVVSDEQKIALLYLNEKEEEEEDDGPWF